MSACSVSLFPDERIRDMTSERFELEKTSAIGCDRMTDCDYTQAVGESSVRAGNK